MAKKNASYAKSNRSSRRRSTTVQRSMLFTIDQLGELPDDDLVRRAVQLRADIENVRRDRCSSTPWEIELCYVQRELDLRNSRKGRFGPSDDEDGDFYREENLPSADLDNSSFTDL